MPFSLAIGTAMSRSMARPVRSSTARRPPPYEATKQLPFVAMLEMPTFASARCGWSMTFPSLSSRALCTPS